MRVCVRAQGAIIGWLSQYPGECEILLPPLTVRPAPLITVHVAVGASGRARLTGRTLLQGLEMQRKGVVDGGMHHLVFRPTLNQSAVRIEVRICTCLPLSTLTPETAARAQGLVKCSCCSCGAGGLA